MNSKDLWKEYQTYTRDLTEHARKLGFAAAAICWFFKTKDFSFPPNILWSLVFLVVFFFFDVLHYVAGALMLRFFLRAQEKKMWKEKETIDADIEKPAWVDCPAFFFFGAKIIVLLVSFVFLGAEFYNQLKIINK